ncbi:MAG: hypothetical protein AAF517_01305 [Planctomycetota bacterium]
MWKDYTEFVDEASTRFFAACPDVDRVLLVVSPNSSSPYVVDSRWR